MAQRNRETGNRNRGQAVRRDAQAYYIDGNTVRKAEPRQRQYQPQRRVVNGSVTVRANREKAHHMSVGYVMFLVCALVAAGFILTTYLGLQSDLTNSIQTISKLESQLNDLRVGNNEEYIRITSKIDLDEVKRIAIQELGMKYAEEGQIITFSGENSDYVRQVADLPK